MLESPKANNQYVCTYAGTVCGVCTAYTIRRVPHVQYWQYVEYVEYVQYAHYVQHVKYLLYVQYVHMWNCTWHLIPNTKYVIRNQLLLIFDQTVISKHGRRLETQERTCSSERLSEAKLSNQWISCTQYTACHILSYLTYYIVLPIDCPWCAYVQP